MSRSAFSERKVIETLLRQGAVIPCFRCRIALTLEDVATVEREHLVEVGLDGENTPENCRYSHGQRSEQGCHGIVTNGNGATSAGSSKHRIAKTKRMAGKKADRFKALPTGANVFVEPAETHAGIRPKRQWASPKLQSRPFRKREARV